MTKITADWLTSDASQRVCKMLTDAGHEAWFVGGCVRNTLIGAPVSDLDLSTSALPDETLSLAECAGLKAIPTGKDHGTITVVADGIPYEVTTFRKDIATDGRRAVVAFAKTMEEDARRRDFTMNALYADQTGTIADPLGGLPDLNARRVRFIENPDLRIKEDYLRILRFFRFHAWYGEAEEGIDAEGLAACADNVDGIETLSQERIGQEMMKLFAAPNPAPAVASFAASGGLMRVLPGADAGMLAQLIHIEELAGIEPDPLRRLAMLASSETAASLRLSKKDLTRLEVMREIDTRPGLLGYRHGADLAIDALAVRAASVGLAIVDGDMVAARHGAIQTFPLKAADLLPTHQGPALGKALKDAEDRWIASGFTLTKDDLLG